MQNYLLAHSKGPSPLSPKLKFACPHCSRRFQRAAGLGSHLRTHGLVGSAPSTLAWRKQKEMSKAPEDTPVVNPSPEVVVASSPAVAAPGAFACPECASAGKSEQFPNAAILGHHRRFKHGIMGKLAIKAREQAARRDLVSSDSIPERRHPQSHDTHPNGIIPISTAIPTHENTIQFDPLAVALAVGRVQEFCSNFAEEHDYAPRTFTRSVAQLLLSQARR